MDVLQKLKNNQIQDIFLFKCFIFLKKKLIFALVKLKLCLDHLFFYLYHYY